MTTLKPHFLNGPNVKHRERSKTSQRHAAFSLLEAEISVHNVRSLEEPQQEDSIDVTVHMIGTRSRSRKYLYGTVRHLVCVGRSCVLAVRWCVVIGQTKK